MTPPTRECDLVLKGGVTSGVIYGGTLVALAREFRLRGIGGTSAGAIAAAFAAAAELRRQRDDLTGFAGLLRRPIDDLATPGFMAGLLRPARGAEPALRVLLALMRQGRKPWRRALAALGHVLGERWWWWEATLVLAGVTTWAVLRTDGTALAITASLLTLVWLFALVPAVLVPVLLTVLATRRVLNSPENGFGLCSGRAREGLALIDWLHQTIQDIADLPLSRPLTFADLEERRIELAMIATDLGRAEPVRFPTAGYWYDPEEFARLFPPEVVEYLSWHTRDAGGEGLKQLPRRELPVLVAVRMSLSVPLLFSAVPLYREDAAQVATRERRSWLLDGGVTSNFPIHFFDEWLPTRPTFGVDLRPFPVGSRVGEAERVVLPGANAPPQRWTGVSGVVTLVQQIIDAAQNWRDTAQAELPGYRDRVCQVRLGPGEGGLHLDMDAATLQKLVAAGDEAGRRLVARFDPAGFEAHRNRRLETLLSVVCDRLRRFGRALVIARGAQPTSPAGPEDEQLTMRIVPRV